MLLRGPPSCRCMLEFVQRLTTRDPLYTLSLPFRACYIETRRTLTLLFCNCIIFPSTYPHFTLLFLVFIFFFACAIPSFPAFLILNRLLIDFLLVNFNLSCSFLVYPIFPFIFFFSIHCFTLGLPSIYLNCLLNTS